MASSFSIIFNDKNTFFSQKTDKLISKVKGEFQYE